jgi:hypothetical protein
VVAKEGRDVGVTDGGGDAIGSIHTLYDGSGYGAKQERGLPAAFEKGEPPTAALSPAAAGGPALISSRQRGSMAGRGSNLGGGGSNLPIGRSVA